MLWAAAEDAAPRRLNTNGKPPLIDAVSSKRGV